MKPILGFEFDSKIIPYSVYNFIQSMNFFVVQYLQSFVMHDEGKELPQVKNQLRIYLYVALAFGVCGQALVLRFEYKSNVKKV